MTEETTKEPMTEMMADAVILLKFIRQEGNNMRTEYSSFDRINNHKEVSLEYTDVALQVIYTILLQQIEKKVEEEKEKNPTAQSPTINWLVGKMIKMFEDSSKFIEKHGESITIPPALASIH